MQIIHNLVFTMDLRKVRRVVRREQITWHVISNYDDIIVLIYTLIGA